MKKKKCFPLRIWSHLLKKSLMETSIFEHYNMFKVNYKNNQVECKIVSVANKDTTANDRNVVIVSDK